MTAPRLTLYHYWRSSASWRVRWAFELKKIKCDFSAIDLLSDDTESPEYRSKNPLGFVPVLEFQDESNPNKKYLSQSMAIINWAESIEPQPALFSQDVFSRAFAIQLCEVINADTAPLQNLPPQFMYSDDPVKRKVWAQTWILKGLHAYEELCKHTATEFSMGDKVLAPDLFLIPQLYNARRYEIEINDFKVLSRIFKNAMTTSECQAACPESYEPKK